MVKSIGLCILLALLPSARAMAAQHAGTSTQRDFVMFVKNYAHKLTGIEPNGKCDDLDFLGKMTRNTKIVAVGESRHSAHEFLQIKRRIVECLVKRDGFTNILLEAGLPYTTRLNDYVIHGEGNLNRLVAGMGYWSLYQNDEFIGLLEWLRHYNATAPRGRRVSLLGFDMQDPTPGVVATLGYFQQVDPAFSGKLASQSGNLTLFSGSPNVMRLARAYKRMPDKQYEALSDKLTMMQKRLESQRSAYIAKTSEVAYNRVLEEFTTVLQAHNMYAMVRSGTFNDLFQAREQAMAENVEWQVKHGGDGGKFILLSHNTHIAKSIVYTAAPNRKTYQDKPLGMVLARDWAGKYLALAATFYRADGRWNAWQNDAQWTLPMARPDSLDAALAGSGDDAFVVDFHDLAPGSPAAAWAGRRQVMRSEGDVSALAPATAYDGVIFTRRLSQAHFTKAAIARFDAMGPPRPRPVHVDKALLDKSQGLYRLSNKTRLQFKEEGGDLYVYWNQWRFKAFPSNNDEFVLRLSPPIAFRFKRATDGSVESMQVRRGNRPWQAATRAQ